MDNVFSTIPTRSPACVLACSGWSAAGELADLTARRLHHLGAAKMSCLAGLGGRIPSITSTVRNAGFTEFKQLKLHEVGICRNDSDAVVAATVARLADEARRVLTEP